MSGTNRRAAPSPKNAASRINTEEHTTGLKQDARASARYRDRFGANVGLLIHAALVLCAL